MSFILFMLGWTFLGACVCAFLDHKYYDGALLEWAKECPFPLNIAVVPLMWPIVLFMFLWDKWKDSHE